MTNSTKDYTMKDVLEALKSMIMLTGEFLYHMGQLILIIASVLTFFGIMVYCIFHWAWITVSVIAAVLLIGWFLIELNTAKYIREQG